jgi:hypothetical protein
MGMLAQVQVLHEEEEEEGGATGSLGSYSVRPSHTWRFRPAYTTMQQ